jgi:hypothetical protein
MDKTTQNHWETPRLAYKGSVADILKSGGGKLSITAADPGEGRCEKPHADQCNGAAQRPR